jgi:hypothetical protein
MKSALLFLAMIPTCQPVPAPIQLADGGGDRCSTDCAALARIGCPEAAPTQAGTSCYELCRAANAYPGMRLPMVADCTSLACVRARGVRCDR